MKRPRSTKSALILASLVSLVWGCGGAAAGRTDGQSIPDPALFLDQAEPGTAVRLTELGEGPYVVVPIFTRCRAVCSVSAKALRSAWGNGATAGDSAQVVLVSFDPEDTRADMARFREMLELPPSWHLATLEREEGLRFFAGLGFQWRTLARRQFDHSGKIFVLTDGLRIASVLGPDQLTAERLQAELAVAKSGPSLARRIGTHWVGFFGVGVILLGLVAVVTWDKVRSRQRFA